MHKLISSFLLSALLVPAALFADGFEGVINMKMTGRDPGAAKSSNSGEMVMLVTVKGSLSRVDTTAQGHSVGMITDRTKQQMTILMTDQRMFMVRPIPAIPANAAAGGAAKGSNLSLEKTGVTEKINGYDCTKYVVKDGNRTTEMWVTDQLGAFPGIGGGGNPMAGGRGGPPPASGWEEALKGKDFFPMRVSMLQDGKEMGRLEVTLVEAHPVEDSTFTPPEGWQDLSAMMRGMAIPGGMIPGMPGRN